MRRQTSIRTLTATALLGLMPWAHAAGPLTMVVPSGAGSAPDIVARLLGDELTQRLGQPVVIDNRPGAGGIVATLAAKSAKADGNTVLLAQAAVVTLTPRRWRSVQTTAASQSTKRLHPSVQPPPRQNRAAGAASRGWNTNTGHRCARPPESRPSAAMARLVFCPCGRAEKRRAGGGRGHRRMSALRALTRCSCLSGSAQQHSEFCSATARSSIAGCPAAQRRGHAQWGRLLLPSFLGESRKEGAPPGACPGLTPQQNTPLRIQEKNAESPTATCAASYQIQSE